MKKHILTLASILLLGATAFAQNGMTKLEQLPAKSQEFIKTYFKDYKVRFEDGTEIEFNAKGEWTDVNGKQNCIPTGFIIKEITDYVNAYHKDACIKEIEKEFNRITIELNNKLELEFNSKGKLISYDD